MKKSRGYTLFSAALDVMRTAPLRFAVEYIATAVNSVAIALIATATSRLFASAMDYSTGSAGFSVILSAALMLVGLNVASEIASGISNYFGEVYSELSIQRLTNNVHAKVANLPGISFEEPNQLDRINGAYSGAASVRQVVNLLMDVLTLYVPYFIIYGIYLYSLRPLLLVIFPLVVVPAVLGQFIKAKISVDAEEESAAVRRRIDAYKAYIGDREFVKETRILGATAYFLKGMETVCRQLAKILTSAKTKSWIVDTVISLIQMLGYGCVIFLLIDSVFGGKIGIADFAAVFATSSMLIELVKELFSDRIGEATEEYGLVKRYIDFMNLPQTAYSGQNIEELALIEADRVSFRYPSAADDAYAVRNLSLKLKKGESLALVGDNGSGKTTLTKLLLGLYAPTSGRILYDGISHSEMNPRSIWKNSTAVFQSFGKYRLTLGENIALGDVSEAYAANAAKQAQVDMEAASCTMDTPLSKEFGGTELSGGQWQRVAIARGIYHMGDLVVLDEPTSAIDPMNEQSLYESFIRMIEGKIGLIVTHRLSLAKCCTRIALMKDGEIAAIGTHAELLENSEYYRLLWQTQSESYQVQGHTP